MIARGCLIIAFVCILSGCAKPFKANWYLQNNGQKNGQQPKMYLSILNQSKEKQTIDKIILNSYKVNCKQYGGWSLQESKSVLEPGDLLVLPATKFTDVKDGSKFPDRCKLPVSVLIMTEQDKSGSVADLVGHMPNLLPEGWENCRTN